MKIANSIRIAALAGLLTSAACTGDFMDKNTNPDQATDEMLSWDNLSTGSAFSQMTKNVIPSFQLTGDEEYGSASYQVIEDLAGNIFAGYTGVINTSFTGNNLYNVTAKEWYNSMFNDAYTRVISAWNQLDPQREEFPEVVALADIVKIAAMHRVTDTYGPIPYLNLSSGSINQSYDSQKEVYNRFFEELDAAISTLTTFYQGQPDTKLLADYDNVFSGNVGNWIKFANTLRLRLALRVVYADASLAQTQAEAALSNPVGLMTSAADLAELKKPAIGTWEYPLYMIQYSFDDSRIGATIEAYMNGYNDPRRSKYFVATASGEYHGVRNGINPTAAYASSTELSRINCTNNDNLLWMTPAEAWFLRAEYELRWGSEDNARTYYEEGIRTSFSTLGVNGVDEYIADQESKPGSYTDVVNGGNSQESALASIPVCWKQGGDFETHLEQIITQKYIAMFPEGQEAWSEFRRTGYPRILTVVVNNSGGKIDTQKQIRRLNFPSTEYSTNAQAVAAATATLNSESSNPTGDNGGTNVWWDKNPRL